MSKRTYRKRAASPSLAPVSMAGLQCPGSRRSRPCPQEAIRRLTDWTGRYFRCSILHKGCGTEWWINGDEVPIVLTDEQADFVVGV